MTVGSPLPRAAEGQPGRSLSKIGTRGFELFSSINNSELSTENSCNCHLCFHARKQFGLWIGLLTVLCSEAHSIFKKKKKSWHPSCNCQ